MGYMWGDTCLSGTQLRDSGTPGFFSWGDSVGNRLPEQWVLPLPPLQDAGARGLYENSSSPVGLGHPMQPELALSPSPATASRGRFQPRGFGGLSYAQPRAGAEGLRSGSHFILLGTAYVDLGSFYCAVPEGCGGLQG